MLRRLRTRHVSAPVIYSRDASSVRLQATVGRTTLEQQTDRGVTLQIHHCDYLITAADLELDGVRITPEPGDRITDAGGAVYEVMRLEGEKAWQWSDHGQSQYRIHTKLVTKASD